MKIFILFALGCTFFEFSPFCAPGQDAADLYPNYVVIGAFAHRENAVRYVDDASDRRFQARFDLNPNRNLYYVFVLATDDREAAMAEARRLQTETAYVDAWVYSGALGEAPPVSNTSDIEPHDGTTLTDVPRHDPDSAMDVAPPQPDPEVSSSLVSQDTLAEDARPMKLKPVDAGIAAEELTSRNFVFHTYNAADGTPLKAEISLIDVARSAKLASYAGNEPVKVVVPSRGGTSFIFICESFGYRKQQRDFDFNAPPIEALFTDDAGNLVVPFEMVRLQKGDISVMYNVFFYRDAAVMRPESRYEVGLLLQMMNENPEYRIKLHGHTNGNAHGKIISRGEGGGFFSLTNTKEGFGSAKKLSERRAGTIMEFLIDQGIAADRIELRAWGGKRPLHDKRSVRAKENVRVEVEILED